LQENILKQETVFRMKFGKTQISYILYFQSAGKCRAFIAQA